MRLLEAALDCPECDALVQGMWLDDSMDPEQRDSAPVAAQSCPNGHTFDAEYPGWSEYGGAG